MEFTDLKTLSTSLKFHDVANHEYNYNLNERELQIKYANYRNIDPRWIEVDSFKCFNLTVDWPRLQHSCKSHASRREWTSNNWPFPVRSSL